MGSAAQPVNDALDALPEDITQAKIAIVWPATNFIRLLKDAHERALASEDKHHPKPLAPEVFPFIAQFADVYNNLVLGDESLSRRDKTAPGPQDLEKDIEVSEIASSSLETAIEHDLFTEAAKNIIEADIAEDREINAKIKAETPLTVLEKLARDNIQREKDNAIRAIILRVRESQKFGKIADGALMAIGATIITYIAATMPALLGLVRGLFGF